MAEAGFKCKTCGAVLDALVAQSQNNLVECPYCLNVWTIPKKETSPAALSFLRMGEHDLDTGKFDDALAAYKKAAELDAKEPEAFFGMALAFFKIQYLKVEPEKEGEKPRLQPICHQVTRTKFTESKNYLRALELATPKQKAEYERRGKEIDYILAEFSRLEKGGVEYDCFLCVKVSGENGKTEDSKDADYIYDLLKRKGYKPFYSEREFRNVTGGDYEARILYALVKSECMLVICRNEEYLQTPWVKNEFTRFLKLVNDEEKESDSIALVFYEKPIERLPGRNGRLQGIDFSRRDADEKLVDFVDSHTPAAKAKRAEETKRKEAQEKERAERDARLAEQLEEQKRAQRTMEERLKNLQTGAGSGGGMHTTVNSLLVRARQELLRGNFEESQNYCKEILNVDPENGAAWTRLFLAEVWQEGTEKGVYPPKPEEDTAISSIDSRCERGDLALLKNALAGTTFQNAAEYGADCAEMREMAERTSARIEEGKPQIDATLRERTELREKNRKAAEEAEGVRRAFQTQMENIEAQIKQAEENTVMAQEAYKKIEKKAYGALKITAIFVALITIFLGVVLLTSFGIDIPIFGVLFIALISAFILSFAFGGIAYAIRYAPAEKKLLKQGIQKEQTYREESEKFSGMRIDASESLKKAQEKATSAKKAWDASEQALQAARTYAALADDICATLREYMPL